MKKLFTTDMAGQKMVLFVDSENKAVYIEEAAFDEPLTLEVAKAADYSQIEGYETAEEAAANYGNGSNLIDFVEAEFDEIVEF